MSTAAGWYPVNEQREYAYWDGTGWTGDRVPNPDYRQRPSTVLASVAGALVLVAAVLLWAGFDLLLSAAG